MGILPRDRGEYAAAAAALCRAVTRAASGMPPQVRVLLARSDLTCEATGRVIPVLDLALRPSAAHDWPGYFAVLDTAASVLAAALRGEVLLPEAACACGPPPAVGEAAGEAPL